LCSRQVVLWHQSEGITLLREEVRSGKKTEWVALGRDFMISLGIPSGLGALSVQREWTVLSKASLVTMAARVTEGSHVGVMTNGSGLLGCSHGGRGSSGGVVCVISLAKCE
jgi:hypothetical protein